MDDKVTDVRNPRECVGKNEDGIALVKKRIREQQQGTPEAQPPEQCRHDDLFLLFSCIPLHEKAREENQVSKPANHFPRVPINSEEVRSRHNTERIHAAI